MSVGDFLEVLSQRILVGIVLAGRLDVPPSRLPQTVFDRPGEVAKRLEISVCSLAPRAQAGLHGLDTGPNL